MSTHPVPATGGGSLTPPIVALRIALPYGIVASLWILTSDWVLGHLVPDRHTVLRLETYKGWAFVAVTTFLLFILARSLVARAVAAETARRATQQRFAQVAELAPAGIITLDTAGTITYANALWREHSGCGQDPHTWPQRLHPEDRELVMSRWEQCLASRSPFAMKFRFLHADGHVVRVLGRAVPDCAENGTFTGFIGTSTDITELSDVKSALRDTEAQFRQAQKMEAVGLLAGGVAHDFNNLLTVIQGNAGLLQTQHPSLADSGPLAEIVRAAGRAGDLTRQLLTFSRKQVLEPKPIDLNDIVTNTARMLKRLIGENITLRVQTSGLPVPVHADPGMLEQVLMNLAVNARDAMPEGGTLTVGTDSHEVTPADAAGDPAHGPGRFARLRVRDTGSGIAPENLSRIFEPFFTTKSPDHGTGLGLATVFGIVRQHQGWIDVASDVGSGTEFTVHLPWHHGDLHAAAGVASPEHPAQGRHERILVVEDDPALLSLITSILDGNGYETVAATSGRQARSAWERESGRFDLLLTDLMLPDGVNGRELAESFRDGQPGLRVLFSSGYGADAVDRQFLTRPRTAFLQKPFVPDTLLRAVRDHLDAP